MHLTAAVLKILVSQLTNLTNVSDVAMKTFIVLASVLMGAIALGFSGAAGVGPLAIG